MKPIIAVVLMARFLKAVVLSGIQTVQVIFCVSFGRCMPPPASLLRFHFAPMSQMGASLLGCMITLTPGTTTLDIDMENRIILLHALDASNADAVVQGIRNDFEFGLVQLFGVRP